jgi:hypothetical protein
MLVSPVAGVAGDEYWTYSYHNVDVVAAGNAAYTGDLARYCLRLDAMLSRILGVKTFYRAPTHVYALPAEQLSQYLGDDRAAYHSSRYESVIVADNLAAHSSDYWGVYFGYTAALLAIDGQLRGPDWYMLGVPLIFASTSYEHGRAKLGNVTTAYGVELGQGPPLIPMRILLKQKRAEVVAMGHDSSRIYEAEVWALAHGVFLERWHRAEFGKYLDLMRQATGETDAFTASFNVSYEQLDKEFASVIHQRPSVYTMEIPEDPSDQHASARRLSAPEVKAQLALLSVRYGKGPDPVQLASEALQMDPHNQTALQALALAELARENYSNSLAAVDKLSVPQTSYTACADSGEVLEGLADAVQSGNAILAVDAGTLRRRAKEDYERALAANSDDRRARAGLARLVHAQ